jgi:hypothetical protein
MIAGCAAALAILAKTRFASALADSIDWWFLRYRTDTPPKKTRVKFVAFIFHRLQKV